MSKHNAIDAFIDDLQTASADQMNGLTQSLMKKGGKFALLARVLMEEVQPDDPRWDKYKPGDSLEEE